MTIGRRNLFFTAGGAFLSGGLLRGADENPKPLGCSAEDDTISCFQPFDFKDSGGRLHRIYAAGTGPPVVVLHELPGLTPADLRFAKRLVGVGYMALVPLLFGRPGDDRFIHNLFSVCGSDDFDCLSTGKTPSPVKWIKEFCSSARRRWTDGLGMGVIGMCLTGEFPLALLALPEMKAAVLCQPTNPLNVLTAVHLAKGGRMSIGEADLEAARKSGVPMLGIRYTGDVLCPKGRFDTLDRLFPNQFRRLDLPGHHHSSLGDSFSQMAFDEVRAFLDRQLKGNSSMTDKPAACEVHHES
jgi:dienelactone hydrolase